MELTACPFAAPASSVLLLNDEPVRRKEDEMVDLDLRLREERECRGLVLCGEDDEEEEYTDDDEVSGIVSMDDEYSSSEPIRQ